MEINVEHQAVKNAWETIADLAWGIQITSTDKQDKGKVYIIPFENITSLEEGFDDEDKESYQLWWKTWILDRWMNSSAHF